MNKNTKTLLAAAAFAALASPALAQVRSGSGTMNFDAAGANYLASRVEEQSRTIASALQRVETVENTVEQHEVRIGNVEIKAISEMRSVTANGGRAVCPQGFAAFLCIGEGHSGGVAFEAQPQGGACISYTNQERRMTASCLRIGITAAAVATPAVAE